MNFKVKGLCETYLKLFGIKKQEHIKDKKYMHSYQVLCNAIKFLYFIFLLTIIYQFIYYKTNNILGLFLWIIILVSVLVVNVLLYQLKKMETN